MCARVCRCEFGRKVREVGEGELARVRLVADAEKADGVLDQVAAVENVRWSAAAYWGVVRTVGYIDQTLCWLVVPSSCSIV